CDAMLLLDDADLKLAARAAWFGVSINRGQTCIAVRRVFVPRPRMEEFAALLKEQARAAPMRLALPAAAGQMKRLADEAVAAGASLLLPVETDGTTVTPALLMGVRPEMALCREASFAPILGVLPYDSLEQALEDEARCPFALSASIFSADLRKAAALALRLRAGSVCVNDAVAPTAHPATPFGGRGASGWGSTQGAEGLLGMTVPQVVSTRGGTWRPHYPTADPAKAEAQLELLRGMLRAKHAPTWWQRMKGWWKLVRAAMRGGL
ncbi:MAG: aldehyde dehydrogenase family protein, partial [Gemmataceae bacterium]|nr:aldehyde dehydrogenase family protein [Gemmataceae bacterium]